jgi:hypothetical protein
MRRDRIAHTSLKRIPAFLLFCEAAFQGFSVCFLHTAFVRYHGEQKVILVRGQSQVISGQ